MFRKKMEEKKNDLITRAEEIVNKAKTEERELSEEEVNEINQIKTDVENIKKTLELTDEVDRMDKTEKEEKTETKDETKEESEDNKEEQETRAFENYIRGRAVHERAGELTKTDNGAVIPSTIVNKIIKKVYDVCPILEKSSKYNVKGKLEIPYYNTETSTITVAYAEEFSPITSSNGKFATIEMDGFLAGALSKISNSLINNSQFDIVSFVIKEMAESIARFIENELLIGTTNKVAGLSTVQNEIVTASATAITADEVIKLKYKIKDIFQKNALFIMHSETRTALRLLKDENGRFLLNDDLNSEFGSKLLGKDVYVSDNMPKMEKGKVAIYYGDLSCLGTKFSEEVNIQILREKYADEHATGVIGWFEFDGKVENEQGLAKLKMKSA